MVTVLETDPLAVEGIWRFSLDQYHALIQTGILTPDDAVELIEGLLVTKIPKNPRHRVVTKLIRTALESCIPDGWYVDSQEPITLGDSEPEPDVVIVQGYTRDYLEHHPTADKLALVVEVSDTTLQKDRTLKKRIYARTGIPCYWLINLAAEQVEVYIHPDPDPEISDYQICQLYQRSEQVSLKIQGQDVGFLTINDWFP